MPLPRLANASDPLRRPDGPRDLVSRGQRSAYVLEDENKEKLRQYRHQVEPGEFGIIKSTQPLGQEREKILGKGGEGITCLFLLTLLDGGQKRMEVKASVKSRAVDKELKNMRVRSLSILKRSGNHIMCC